MKNWHAILAFAVILLIGAALHKAPTTAHTAIAQDQRPPSARSVNEAPLTIAMSNVGRFSKGHSWYLSVNSAGQAELTIDTLPDPIRRTFTIDAQQLTELRTALLDHDFFELANSYGELVPDGSADSITVTAGDMTKSVTLHFLMNWVSQKDVEKLRDPCRAVRIGMIIRDWFNDPEAVDLRRYDQMVLDACK